MKLLDPFVELSLVSRRPPRTPGSEDWEAESSDRELPLSAPTHSSGLEIVVPGRTCCGSGSAKVSMKRSARAEPASAPRINRQVIERCFVRFSRLFMVVLPVSG